jgi:hypothetical protein
MSRRSKKLLVDNRNARRIVFYSMERVGRARAFGLLPWFSKETSISG